MTDKDKHDAIDKLTYKGQVLGHSEMLDYVFKQHRKEYMEKHFCYYCTALDWNYRGRGIPLENETHFGGPDKPYIRVIPGNEYNLQKPRWLLVTWDGAHPIKFCPMCGRKLDEHSKVTVIPHMDYGAEGY